MVSKRGGPVSLALRAGGRVLKKEEIKQLKRVLAARQESYSVGVLEKNFVISRGKPIPIGNGERVVVKIRRKVYPARHDRKPVTTRKTAHILEYGSEKQVATPFLRPAFNAAKNEVVVTVTRDLVVRVAKIVRKLGR